MSEYDSLIEEWNTEGLDPEMNVYRAKSYADRLCDALRKANKQLEDIAAGPSSSEPRLDILGNRLAGNADERCEIALGLPGDDSKRCERLAFPLHRTHLIEGMYYLPTNSDELNEVLRDSTDSKNGAS